MRYVYLALFISSILIGAKVALHGEETSNLTPLEAAIWQVETGSREGTIWGKHEERGPLQITRSAWIDANLEGEWSDCDRLDYAVLVFRAYQDRYATHERLGREPTDQDKARIWNGGPLGHYKDQTKKYWNKVRTVLERG